MAIMLVLGVTPYKFKNDATGEVIEGITIICADEPAPRTNGKGLQPMKVAGALTDYPQFNIVPGYYEMDFSLVPGVNSKPMAKYKSSKFVKPLQLNYSTDK